MIIPRFSPAFRWSDLAALAAGAGAVERFERALAERLGASEALLLPRGRTAAYLYLKALGGEGEVVLPAYTCLTLPPAVLAAGFRPVFVDAAPNGFSTDPSRILDAVGPRTRAVIPTPMYGFAAGEEAYASLRGRGVGVLLDAALALGLWIENDRLGRSADAALFAFGLGKEVSTVFGGALVSIDAALVRRAREVWSRVRRPVSIRTRAALVAALPASLVLFRPAAYPLLHALSERTRLLDGAKGLRAGRDLPREALEEVLPAQAALGLRRLERLETLLARRAAQVEAYRAGLADLEGEGFRLPPPGRLPSYFPVRVRDREGLARALLAAGFHSGTRVFDYVAAEHPAFAAFARGTFPNAERLAREVLLLPLHDDLRLEDQERIIETVRGFVRGR